ncbi:hypothetical protein KKA14_11240, partial [bacterium]|nr:hypothetical protein [bacterium]
LFINWNVNAQTIDFLPKGVFLFSYGIESSTSDQMLYSGMSTESIVKNLLNRENVDSSEVSGSIDYTDIIQLVTFQYGLFENINLGITIPSVIRKRNSSLSSSTVEGINFSGKYQSAETNGIGDIEIWGNWRLVYSDSVDFRMGVSIIAGNAPYNYDSSTKMPLGDGAPGMGFFIRCIIYSQIDEYITDIRFKVTSPMDSTVTDSSGESLEMRRGNSLEGYIMLSKNIEAWNFGGGLNGITKSQAMIGDEGQSDGYVNYSLTLFAGYGNLNQLEQGPIAIPWNIKLSLNSVFAGNNTLQKRAIGLTGYLYF